jgi:hypothetical protein
MIGRPVTQFTNYFDVTILAAPSHENNFEYKSYTISKLRTSIDVSRSVQSGPEIRAILYREPRVYVDKLPRVRMDNLSAIPASPLLSPLSAKGAD